MGVQWRDSFAIGIAEIDNQHRELVDAVNRLLDACSKSQGDAEVSNTIAFLEKYVIQHFDTEERLQIKYGYPQYSSHKKEHEQFIKDFLELKGKINKGGSSLAFITQINQTVMNWLVKHISVSDKSIGEYILQSKGK